MDKKQIEEYLAKYNIANKEQLSLHIEQLRRNTSPNVRLISELEWIMADGYFGEEKPYFTTNVTSVSQFFSAEKERVKNIFSTNVQEALQRAEEHQAQFGREESYEADRFSPTVENKIRQEKVKTVLDDVISTSPFYKRQLNYQKNNRVESKDDTIFNNNRAERDTMEFLKAGIKETDGKLDYSEINFEILDLMSERFTANKHKYPQGNMKKPMDIKKLEWALFRHVKKMVQPIQNDEETYEQHLASSLCNLSMILDQLKLNKS